MNYDSAYALALELKQKALNGKKVKHDADVQKLYDSSEQYRDIVNTLSRIGPELAISAFSGDTTEFDKLQMQAKKLNEAKKALLTAAGIAEIEYDCGVCKDTGYVGKTICECVKRSASEILLKDSGLSVDNECTFEKFNLGFYPDDKSKQINPKEQMTSVFNYVRDYSVNFSKSTSESMLFIGKTGLGKTFLSLSVFNYLVKQGFNVIYKPAFNLFSEIENEHFNLRIDNTYNDAITTDLLIIDDLGTEFVSPFIKSVFYNIINSRLLSGKPTIISTNLSLEEIEKIYTYRVSSRIFGNYSVKSFAGNDIRQIKLAYHR